MGQILKLRRSAIPGAKPSLANIELGEIAMNTYDGKVFMRISGSGGEDVIEVGSRSGSFTGSFIGNFSGSFNGSASGDFTGYLHGTASFAVSTSYVLSSSYSFTSSYGFFAVSSSYALSASYAATASSADFFYVRNDAQFYGGTTASVAYITSGGLSLGKNSPTDPSAILELSSITKGLLLPRLTRVQRDAIPSPAIGLMIYQTDELNGLYMYY